MDKSRFLESIRQGTSDPWLAGRYFDLKPDSPPPPDYTGAARAQGAANVDAAIASSLLSNPQTFTPYGSREVVFDPSRNYTIGTGENERIVPGITITDTLSPTEQAKLDKNNALSLGLLDTAQSGLGAVNKFLGVEPDVSSLPKVTTPLGPAGLQVVSDALLQRLQPMFERDRERLQSELVNSGFARGSAGYEQGMDQFNRQMTDARLAALGQAVNAQTASYGAEADARAKALQEMAYIRQLPLTEINALRTGNQPVLPQFQQFQGQQISPAPLYQAAADTGDWNLGMTNARNAYSASLMNGLARMGAAALPFIL